MRTASSAASDVYKMKTDTGISVRVSIIKDDDRLTIINGTYWHSESTYGHNKFHRLHGAWDVSLEIAIDAIKIMATKDIEAKIQSHKKWIQTIIKENEKQISKFESMF